MPNGAFWKTLAVATLIAGTLDLLAAFFFAGRAGMPPGAVLQFVASGPLGDGTLRDQAFVPAGVAVHYAIMTCMAAAYLIAAQRIPALTRRPILMGALYGFALWILMYWIVRPLRWPDMPLPHQPGAIAGQLFCHVILVGIPIALIAARVAEGGVRQGAERAA